MYTRTLTAVADWRWVADMDADIGVYCTRQNQTAENFHLLLFHVLPLLRVRWSVHILLRTYAGQEGA